MRIIVFCILGIVLIVGCRINENLPAKKYYPFDYSAKYSYNNDTLKVELGNPLLCPLRVSFSSPDKSVDEMVAQFGTVTLKEKSDTIAKYYLKAPKGFVLNFNSIVGDTDKEIVNEKFSLPFPKNREYKVIQGYNGSHSHYTDDAKYAIDFSLKIKDTVCSAADGYVVGVVKDNTQSGTTEGWIDYANYITIYHPQSGLFTQYVHLNYNGSFVKVGDTVLKGQPIGLSGMTGYTTIAHLHFNVKKPDKKEGWVSTDFEFEEGYKGKELSEGAVVRK